MSKNPHDPHNISADEFRKFAGLPLDVKRSLREEKVDLATADLFQYIERVMFNHYALAASPTPVARGPEKDDPSCYEVALECCNALEKKGYSKESLSAVRDYLSKMQAATEVQSAAAQAMHRLSRERWDKNEIY